MHCTESLKVVRCEDSQIMVLASCGLAMKLSIIIPVYNTEAYLKECLDSVFVDNHFTGQVICVNDGSIDGSLSILEQYAKKYPNIEIYTQENQGQGGARNTGLDKATGDYVLFLDSDDYYSKGAIAFLTELAKRNPEVDFFYMDGTIKTDGKRLYTLDHEKPVKMALVPYYDYEYSEYCAGPRGCICSGMYKHDFIERNHLRMLPKCRYEDELFIFEVFLKNGMCMAIHVDEPYYNYRVGRDGATTAHYTLEHFFNRRTIVHACYKAMKEANLLTDARKHHIFGLLEENMFAAYTNGFKKDISKFFKHEDYTMFKECARSVDEIKISHLASLSPKWYVDYRSGLMSEYMRRIVNGWFGFWYRKV